MNLVSQCIVSLRNDYYVLLVVVVVVVVPIDPRAHATFDGLVVEELARRKVLDGQAQRLEQRDVRVARATRHLLRQHLGNITEVVVVSDLAGTQWNQEVARLAVERLLAIRKEPRALNGIRIELASKGSARSNSLHCQYSCQSNNRAIESRCLR